MTGDDGRTGAGDLGNRGGGARVTGAGVRRASPGAIEDPGSDPDLVAIIRAEIAASGPMTFARFMDLALYHPEHGYYAGNRGPGRDADFLTAPEAHPIFGWSIATQVEEVWERLGRPAPFTVREYGSGTGSLAAGLVDGLARRRSPLRPLLRYRAVERGGARLAQLRDRLASVGGEDVLEPETGDPITGVVIANEVLDALPVHRVVGRPGGGIDERFVTVGDDGAFAALTGPATPGLAERLASEGVALQPGQDAEVCLTLDGWIAEASAGLDRGLLLLVDYGHPAAALYAPTRGSLLRAYLRHRVHADPFVNVGRQDLTAHVDLTAVERAGAAAGLDHLGTTRQGAFLAGLGAGDLLVGLQDTPGVDIAAYLEARAALMRMLDPAATGGFGVVLLGRGLATDPPLRGLSVRLPGAH